MIESQNRVRVTISEEIMLARLEQSEQMREFFIEMWKQNPNLAKQGGVKVKNLLTRLERVDLEAKPFSPRGKNWEGGKQRGISLVELIMFIVIISVALAGILLVMDTVTKSSADPLIHKQAIAAAESLLEEIQLQDFVSQDGTTHNCVTPGVSPCVTPTSRSTVYHVIQDYNGFNMPSSPGIFSINDSSSAVLPSYSASVAVSGVALGTVLAGSAVLVTVTVTDPQGTDIQISGYRTAY